MNIIILCALGLVWGLVWAIILQYTAPGAFIVHRHAWIAVIIGLSGDLLIAIFAIDLDAWLRVVAIVTASAIAIVGRSLYNEWQEHLALLRMNDDHQDQDR